MTNQSSSSAPAATASLTQLVEAYLAAWNSRDGAAAVASLAPGGTYVDPSLPGPGLRGRLGRLRQRPGDRHAGLLRHRRNPRDRWTRSAHLDHDRHQYRAAARPPRADRGLLRSPWTSFCEVGADGINSVDTYFDQLTFLRQVGINVNLSFSRTRAEHLTRRDAAPPHR